MKGFKLNMISKGKAILTSLLLSSVLAACGTAPTNTNTAAVDPYATTTSTTAVASSTTPVATMTMILLPATGSVPADGASKANIVVTVKDANGAPIENKTVQFFDTTATAAQMSASTVQTDITGTAILDVTDPVAEVVTIKATADTKSATKSIVFTAVSTTAAPTTGAVGSFTLSALPASASAIADGSTPVSLIANVKDTYGAPLAGQVVSFVDVYGSAVQISTASQTTDGTGTVTITVVDPVAESATIQATVAGIKRSQVVTFTANGVVVSPITPTVGSFTLSALPASASAVADGTSSISLVANVKDNYGSPIVGQTITFTDIYGSAIQISSAGKVTTDKTGTAVVTVVDPVAESTIIQASFAGISRTQVVTFTASGTVAAPAVPTVGNFTLTVQPSSGAVPADGTSTAVLVANVKDNYGSPIVGQTVTFIDVYGSSSQIAQGGKVTTDATGTATVTVADPVAESVTIEASINGVKRTGVINFALTNIQVVIRAAQPFVANSTAHTVDVYTYDSLGNTKASQTLRISVDKATAIPSATQITTDATGHVSFTLADSVAETVNITLSDATGNLSFTAPVTFVAGQADSIAMVADKTSGLVANGVDKATITIAVRDAYGAAVGNAWVDVTTTDPYVQLSQGVVQTDNAGQATVTVSSLKNTVATIKAKLSKNAGAAIQVATVDVSFGPLAVGSIVITSSNLSIPADGNSAATLIIEVKDTAGNPVVGETLLATSPSTTVTFSPTTLVTGSNGIATLSVTDTVAEAASIQVASSTVTNQSATASVTFTEVVSTIDPYTVVFTNALDAAATPLNQSVSADVYTTPVLADSYTAYASGIDTVQIAYLVRGTTGAPISGLLMNFSTSGRAVITPTTGVTDTNGLVSVTVTDAYAELVTVSVQTNGKTGTQSITFKPLPAANIVLSSTNPAPAVIGLSGAGVSQSVSLTFTVVDSNSNPVQGNNLVDFSIVNGGLNGGESLTVNQASTVNGQVTAVVNAGELAGTIQVRATLNADTTIFTEVPVAITGGLPTGDAFSMTMDVPNVIGRIDAGAFHTLTAWVADFFSNPVAPGQQVSFQTDFANVTGTATFNPAAQGNAGIAGASFANATVQAAAGSPKAPVDGLVTIEGTTIGGNHSKVLSLAVVDQYTFYAGTDGGGVYKTTDGGATWIHPGTPLKTAGASKHNNLLGSIVRSLKLDPSNSSTLYAATEKGLFVSTDQGANWTTLTGRKRIVGDQLGTTAVAGSFVKNAGINGLWTDNGTTSANYLFNFQHSGVRARTKIYIDGVLTDSYVLTSTGIQLIGSAGVTLDGVSVTAGTSVITADYDAVSPVAALPIWDVVVDTSTYDPARGYSQTIYMAVYGSGVWKSVDAGQHWTKSSTMQAGDVWAFDNRVMSLGINPINGPGNVAAELWVGTDGSGVYRSVDNGATWSHQQGLTDSVIHSIYVEPNTLGDATKVWVGGKNGVHYTINANVAPATWAQATMATSAGTNPDVRGIKPGNVAGTLYSIVFGDITGRSQPLGGVYISIDAGVTWSKLSNLATVTDTGAHRLDALAVLPGAADLLVVGSEGRSVYKSADGGVTWAIANGAAPTAMTNELFTTLQAMHSGSTALQVIPQVTTYQPMNDGTVTGYTNALTMYHGETHTFVIRVSDDLGNPLVAGSTLDVTVDQGTISGITQQVVLPGVISGSTDYVVSWTNDLLSSDFTSGLSTLPGTMSVSVTSANGSVTAAVSRTLVKPLTAITSTSVGSDPYSITISAEGGSNGVSGYTFTSSVNSCVAGVGSTTPSAIATCPNQGQSIVTGTLSTTFYYPVSSTQETIAIQDIATGQIINTVVKF